MRAKVEIENLQSESGTGYMEKKPFVEKLLENTPLAIIVIGLVLFLIGANGGWSKADLKIDSPTWRSALAAMGFIVFAVGGLFLWQERNKIAISPKNKDQSSDRTKIEGEYHTRDSHHYRIIITHLSENYYRIKNPDWEGVGLFDGEFYYTVFKINDKATHPERRDNWGAHRSRFRPRDKSFEVFGTELKEESHYNELRGEWLKKADVK
ncbi:MAG: hypothetical protein L0220_24865 [Acidobacteria bacterium]|nr:hypothetical protein [Acidobacteriota bacterium]